MIAIIGAMEVEIANLLKKCTKITEQLIQGQKFYQATLKEKTVVITQLGIGKVNAAINLTLLLTHFQIDIIINTGIAGGLKPLSINDIVVSDKIYYYDVDIRFFGYQYGQVAGEPYCYQTSKGLQMVLNNSNLKFTIANICSGDKFVSDKSLLKDILEIDSSISVADMESAALAHVANRFDVDFIVIRSISDIVDDDNQLEKYDEASSAMHAQEILLNLLEHL